MPEYLQNWAKILYTRFEANTVNNGHFLRRIQISRGVHQGGPTSPLFFICCAELLAIVLRSNQYIKGIPMEDIINTLGQYADDVDLYLLSNGESLDNVLKELGHF